MQEELENKEIRIMQSKFGFFGPATLIYAIISVFCIYKNPSGILFPIMIVSTLVYLAMALEKLGRPLQKSSLFYLISLMLLGVSTFCTDDGRIIALNKLFIFLLIIVLLLRQFCDTSKWQLGKHLTGMLQLLFCSIGEMGRPFGDGLKYCKEKNKVLSKNVAAVLIGIGVAFPLLWIVSMLLADADAVFGKMVDSALRGLQLSNTFGNCLGIAFRVVVIFVLAYAWLSYLSAGGVKSECQEYRKGDPVIAITVTGILSAVYLLFSGIQVIFLFFGGGNLPEGYTYAGYAREGFFQLLAVSILNLLIVLVALYLFADHKVLKGILTVMSLCTFVMILSSALRMIMYIRYYYLTFQRVFVLWTLVILFVLFTGVIINIYKKEFDLFRYGVVVVTVVYLAFSFSHPDYYIAKVNLSRAYYEGLEQPDPKAGDFFQSDEFYNDFWYLRNTCADAAPVLVSYVEERGLENMAAHEKEHIRNYLKDMEKKAEKDTWRSFNISRFVMSRRIN